MEYLVGAALALGVRLFAALVGLARYRAFYPTMAIVVASYYGLFALTAGSVDALKPELIGIAVFVVMAVLGFRISPWFAAGALLAARRAASGQYFPQRVRPHVDAELQLAQERMTGGDFAGAFRHLERAHVLGQLSTREHVRVHWHMLRWALRQRRLPELAGQVLRIIGAALLSAVGLVPEGNTGGANVSGFRRMAVPRDLAAIISAARARPSP